KLPGIHLREESRRYYPSGEVTAHLIGFTNVDSQGIEGVEKSFADGYTVEGGGKSVTYTRVTESEQASSASGSKDTVNYELIWSE
ncbi:peptidoglycan glycosyltransferase FtsI, partial [Salmonella enterica subsp. enterica serovar Kentucky]|nr:peptidoglycan glycosyltransferase FtsI [Salmonella enterica subsp. enterica serovar Kentucky]